MIEEEEVLMPVASTKDVLLASSKEAVVDEGYTTGAS